MNLLNACLLAAWRALELGCGGARLQKSKSMGSMRIDVSHCIVSLSLQRNNGELASKGPCQAGFSQSFYSVLVSRDVLQDRRILKGRTTAPPRP